MVNLSDIEQIYKNRGGLQRVDIVFENDILSAPLALPSIDTIRGQVETIDGATPYLIYFTPSSAQFKETQKDSEAGEYWEQQIQFKSPHNRPLHHRFVQRLQNNLVAVSFLDWNGHYKLVRNMRAKLVVDSGRKSAYNAGLLSSVLQIFAPFFQKKSPKTGLFS